MFSVAVIDYGMGNLHSIAKALEHASEHSRVEITAEPAKILAADRVVFPGVGAMRDCMAELKRQQLMAVVIEAAQTRPFLGICLGMQALLDHSEENGGTTGLGLVAGEVRYFGERFEVDGQTRLKIPHMGWNQVFPTQDHPLWQNIAVGSRFYFVHSYYADPTDPQQCAAKTPYGLDFCAAIAQDNIFAIQCHPEKSQQVGLQLLHNFIEWQI